MSEDTERAEIFMARAAAHSRTVSDLARPQRWRNGVTDTDVAAVFYAMEAEGVRLSITATGRWLPPQGRAGGVLRGVDTSATVREMVRTGLLRHWLVEGVSQLAPARVHLEDAKAPHLSACRTPVESMPGGRIRLVGELVLVDCLECERAMVWNVDRRL